MRQSLHHLQRKPVHGRRLVSPQGNHPPSHPALQVTTKAQPCFWNVIHTRSNTRNKNRCKTVLGHVIQIKSPAGYLFLKTGILMGHLPWCHSLQQLQEGVSGNTCIFTDHAVICLCFLSQFLYMPHLYLKPSWPKTPQNIFCLIKQYPVKTLGNRQLFFAELTTWTGLSSSLSHTAACYRTTRTPVLHIHLVWPWSPDLSTTNMPPGKQFMLLLMQNILPMPWKV